MRLSIFTPHLPAMSAAHVAGQGGDERIKLAVSAFNPNDAPNNAICIHELAHNYPRSRATAAKAGA
jgi:hypothetical protein